MANSIEIGIARTDITPAVGIPMVGFAGRGPSTRVNDPLYATAMAVSCAGEHAVLIALDLLQFKAETVAEFRALIQAASGIPADRITLACSHTHYGPDIDRAGRRSPSPGPSSAEGAELVDAYRIHLGFKLSGLVQEAQQNLKPARMGIGWGSSDIGINRREKTPDGRIILGNNYDGPVDREVGIARIEDIEGNPIACLVNFATHPVAQTSQQRAISAGFSGKMARVVEGLTGAYCLFLQGAAGNINPVAGFRRPDQRPEDLHKPSDSLGIRLGCEAVRVWETISIGEAQGLNIASKAISLPRYMYGDLKSAKQLDGEFDQELKTRNLSEGQRYWTELRQSRVREAIRSHQTGVPLDPVETELQAWRIGDLAFVSVPAEIFTENGTLVKNQSSFDHTFFVGYANGSIGYVPTVDAYPEGGYEVTHACQVDPEAGGMINENCLALLRQHNGGDSYGR